MSPRRRDAVEFNNDGRKEQGERVERAWTPVSVSCSSVGEAGRRTVNTHVHQHSDPGFPVPQRVPHVRHLEVFMAGRTLLVVPEPPQYTRSVLVAEEPRIVGEVDHNPEGDDSDNYGCDAFQDLDIPVSRGRTRVGSGVLRKSKPSPSCRQYRPCLR